MNKNKHYLISDASRQVQVEAHVLRYWEDELGLPIPRNELGHRYPCNICLLTEFQHNFRSNVVLFEDLYSSFLLFDRVFFKKITVHTLS